jgi:catechol 2,3-dioxygenase-like lactoylglutathione lyase family enzyme
MKVEHIALNIIDPNEIIDFYQNVLGMVEIRNYTLDKNLANLFFHIDRETSVYLMQKDYLFLELFVNRKSYNHGFNHICLEIKNRETIVSTAVENSYKCIRRKRDYFDQIFIRDNSGNIFEIKEADKSVN